jgi:hypothetical protein
LKDTDRKQFIEARDIVSITEELKESLRRRKVLNGEWKESESMGLVNQLMAETIENSPNLQ